MLVMGCALFQVGNIFTNAYGILCIQMYSALLVLARCSGCGYVLFERQVVSHIMGHATLLTWKDLPAGGAVMTAPAQLPLYWTKVSLPSASGVMPSPSGIKGWDRRVRVAAMPARRAMRDSRVDRWGAAGAAKVVASKVLPSKERENFMFGMILY